MLLEIQVHMPFVSSLQIAGRRSIECFNYVNTFCKKDVSHVFTCIKTGAMKNIISANEMLIGWNTEHRC